MPLSTLWTSDYGRTLAGKVIAVLNVGGLGFVNWRGPRLRVVLAEITIATLAFGLGHWHLTRGDKTQARASFERAVRASDGWPGFGFILSEVELQRVR